MRDLDLVVVGYPDHLVADHAALVGAARGRGWTAEVVHPSRLALAVDAAGARVLVDGVECRPRAALPRGVNRPWPFVRQVLDLWARAGTVVVPSVAGAEVCSDKLASTVRLAAAGVPVLATLGVVPGDGVTIDDAVVGTGALVSKPARGSKARGVERHVGAALAAADLGQRRPLVDDTVDHRVVQALATGAGHDLRVVVARRGLGAEAVAVTRRTAPAGSFVTNLPGATYADEPPGTRLHAEAAAVATAAVDALGLDVGGVDLIEHDGSLVVLEVNAWPGLAAEVRGPAIAEALVDVVAGALDRRLAAVA